MAKYEPLIRVLVAKLNSRRRLARTDDGNGIIRRREAVAIVKFPKFTLPAPPKTFVHQLIIITLFFVKKPNYILYQISFDVWIYDMRYSYYFLYHLFEYNYYNYKVFNTQ